MHLEDVYIVFILLGYEIFLKTCERKYKRLCNKDEVA